MPVRVLSPFGAAGRDARSPRSQERGSSACEDSMVAVDDGCYQETRPESTAPVRLVS
jgi:hypothetical protein